MRPYVWFQAEVVDMDREVQFLLYNMPEDSGKVQVVIKDETIWCTLITEYVTSNTFIRDGL